MNENRVVPAVVLRQGKDGPLRLVAVDGLYGITPRSDDAIQLLKIFCQGCRLFCPRNFHIGKDGVLILNNGKCITGECNLETKHINLPTDVI